ncbi:hypothetical protein GIB67_039718 [Kingdonia uniflora]|uniref:Serine/threonine-protein phosphatase 4 regulatory subunit 3-like central domain-containing protein n=1 Tax=Kingdonia uniflora TaxID=39325 RepID=A0A7J7MQ55_9MAGN|nr:hypothetical protein GIB67_039718 [Kingdonia uniflora]
MLFTFPLFQRVKVYRLNEDGKWGDRGTGHVTVDHVEGSEDLGLFVIDEEDNETLLAHRIRSDNNYRRQEETIISWRDQEHKTELALSFQEATGCSYIWEHISTMQRGMQVETLCDVVIGPRPATEKLETSGSSQANDETFHNVNGGELRDLPAVELSTLPLILKTVVESGIADQMRVSELILHDQDFFEKLMDLFKICEDLENFDGLHIIFRLVKGIILLNSPLIFEKLFKDEFIMDVIGSLEYDPEVSDVQNHRAFLKDHVVFKEAIPIKDPNVLSKIHQTYRVGYIKDVILPRVLDESTVSSLNSIIHGNNAVVVSSLKEDNTFIKEMFASLRSSSILEESKKNLVYFLHEFCCLSKSLQMVHQLRLFRDLANEGIFDIIADALETQDKKVILTGTDILILFMNQDPSLLRTYVTRKEGNNLLGLLVKGMITDFGDEMHCQFLEILRILLDSYTLSGSQRDTTIDVFYDKHLDQLIDVIISSCPPKAVSSSEKSAGTGEGVEQSCLTKPEILLNICELLCFCVQHHPYRIRGNFLFNNVIGKVLCLTCRREKYLVVAAVRFVRIVIARHDDQLLHSIVKNNLLKPIVEAFISNGHRYNLLNSAILELFELIRKDNLKNLIVYLVDSFWNQLAEFGDLASIRALKVKYEQNLESCEAKGVISMINSRKRIDERALDKEEEDYFNEDSDEEDTASARSSDIHNQEETQPVLLPNGSSFSSPPSRLGSGGLVDYDDDDDDEDCIPPSGSKPEILTRGNDVVEDLSNLKRKFPDMEDLETTKRPKLDNTQSNGSDVACSTCNDATTPSEETTEKITEENYNSSKEKTSSEKELAIPRSCESRKSGEEECILVPPNGNNSSLDMSVTGGGASVSGTEPYSVW